MAVEQSSHIAGISSLYNDDNFERQLVPSPRISTSPAQSSETRPCNIELFVIRVQHKFTEKAELPPLNVWKRVVDRHTFRFASLQMDIKRRVFFHFERQVVYGTHTCILSKQGHLVIYTDTWKNEGFTVNLSKATRAVFKCKKQKVKKTISSESHIERICKIRLDWDFGSVKIRLPESLSVEWGRAILEAVNGKEVWCHPRWRPSSMNQTGPPLRFRRNSQTDVLDDHTQTATCIENLSDSLDDTSGFTSTAILDNSFIEKESNDDVLNMSEEHSHDQSLNIDKDQSQQTQKTTSEEESAHGEKIAFPLEKAMLINFPEQNKEEEHQQNEEYIPESAIISGSSLRRRVTFSDLNTIFEVQEPEVPIEDDESSEIELKKEESIPKLGCPNVKDTEGIEERRKEPIVQSALDQMRIVGQHGVKETTEAEASVKNDENNKNSNEDEKCDEKVTPQPCEQKNITDGDNFVSTQQLALKMQFPSQSERFDRTRYLFEHGAEDEHDEEGEDKSKQ